MYSFTAFICSFSHLLYLLVLVDSLYMTTPNLKLDASMQDAVIPTFDASADIPVNSAVSVMVIPFSPATTDMADMPTYQLPPALPPLSLNTLNTIGGATPPNTPPYMRTPTSAPLLVRGTPQARSYDGHATTAARQLSFGNIRVVKHPHVVKDQPTVAAASSVAASSASALVTATYAPTLAYFVIPPEVRQVLSDFGCPGMF